MRNLSPQRNAQELAHRENRKIRLGSTLPLTEYFNKMRMGALRHRARFETGAIVLAKRVVARSLLKHE